MAKAGSVARYKEELLLTHLDRICPGGENVRQRPLGSQSKTKFETVAKPVLTSVLQCFDGQMRLAHIRGKLRKKVYVMCSILQNWV